MKITYVRWPKHCKTYISDKIVRILKDITLTSGPTRAIEKRLLSACHRAGDQPPWEPMMTWGTFLEPVFHRNSNSIEILSYSHPSYREAFATVFCTWHDSCTIVARAELCSETMPYNGTTLKPISPRIWMTMGKIVREMGLRFTVDVHMVQQASVS